MIVNSAINMYYAAMKRRYSSFANDLVGVEGGRLSVRSRGPAKVARTAGGFEWLNWAEQELLNWVVVLEKHHHLTPFIPF
jgi:hypothetical protein